MHFPLSAPRAFDSAEAFWAAHVEQSAMLAKPVDRAIAGGALADRLGYAFTAGYAAALQALVLELGPRTAASLAATEERGAHPKFIQTALTPDGADFQLNGKKSWVTLASEVVLVLARVGESRDGRADLRLVRIDRSREGVRTVALPPPPFVPEIPHAELHFENVLVRRSELLEGDGWNRWVKPFRTVEDIHVHAALMGHLTSTAVQLGWPERIAEKTLGIAAALRSLAADDPSSATVHLALAGCIEQSSAIVEQIKPLWTTAAAEVRERWERDSPLLGVAGKAREARRLKAWETMRITVGTSSSASDPRAALRSPE